jgi:hypothetical protein
MRDDSGFGGGLIDEIDLVFRINRADGYPIDTTHEQSFHHAFLVHDAFGGMSTPVSTSNSLAAWRTPAAATFQKGQRHW